MAETVKIPGAGPVKRQWVYAGGALLVGIVGYAYYKRARTPVVEPISPDALPEDRVPFTDAQVSSGLGVSQTAGAPVTVADWVRQATDRLIELGNDATAVAAALGAYVTHQKLTTTQAGLVQQAIGQFGYPTNDAGSYPVLLASATTTPPPTTGGTPTKLGTPSVRAARADTRGRYRLTWNKISGASYYLIKQEMGPGAPKTGPWVGTSWTSGILRSNYTYQYRVQAHAPGKSPSNWSEPVRFKV